MVQDCTAHQKRGQGRVTRKTFDNRPGLSHAYCVVYRFVPRNPRPDLLVLTVGIGWRIFFAGLGLIIGYGMIDGGGVGIFALIVTVILLLSACYLDYWEFDREAARIAHRTGLLFAYRTRRYPLTDLQEVRASGIAATGSQLDQSGPRSRGRSYARLWLRFREAGDVDVQIESGRNSEPLRSLGTDIAAFCDVPYRDMG